MTQIVAYTSVRNAVVDGVSSMTVVVPWNELDKFREQLKAPRGEYALRLAERINVMASALERRTARIAEAQTL